VNYSAETEADGESSVMHMHAVVHFVSCLLTMEKKICMQKNEKSNTYSMIKNRPNTPIKINSLALEGSSSVFLIIEKTKSEIETLWKNMLIFEKNITAKNIGYFLDSNDSLLLCRFYEEETHAATQFIYPTKFKDEISSALKKNKIQKINIQDTYNFIHHKL